MCLWGVSVNNSCPKASSECC
jgi:hypothetical protein